MTKRKKMKSPRLPPYQTNNKSPKLFSKQRYKMTMTMTKMKMRMTKRKKMKTKTRNRYT